MMHGQRNIKLLLVWVSGVVCVTSYYIGDVFCSVHASRTVRCPSGRLNYRVSTW